MNQEELDALMNGVGDDEINAGDDADLETSDDGLNQSEENALPQGYNEGSSSQWPLPATDENKMVDQLDDVTKESEEKASEIFDIIEGISNDMMDEEETINNIAEVLSSNIELFTTLSAKFPDVEAFGMQLEKNKQALKDTNETLELLQTSGDSIMNVMDIMQYQDIHRQKIERVINVMRSLAKYMNTLFESKKDDASRVSSAQHIEGDSHNDTASADDIEALLEQFGN
ncbi:MAG: chemotaxis protein [Sulfurimonas sp.]|nr:MAG: chemotaxis protein [Sulfurimonas sp.]